LMFDWRQIRRWGIDERLIPADSIVMFREPTIFEAYRWYVLGFLGVGLLQAVLIGALLIERRVRRRAVEEAKAAERSYRTVADFNYDWEYWERLDGSYAYVSPSVLRVTGHHAREFYERPALTSEIVVPEDREGWDAHSRAARAGADPGGTEFRITTATGEVRWIEHMCTPVTEHGRFSGVRGSNRDITGRKRAEENLRRAFAEIQQLRDQLEVDNTYLTEELKLRGGTEGVVGTSDAIGYVLGRAKQVAATSSTVLLLVRPGWARTWSRRRSTT